MAATIDNYKIEKTELHLLQTFCVKYSTSLACVALLGS